MGFEYTVEGEWTITYGNSYFILLQSGKDSYALRFFEDNSANRYTFDSWHVQDVEGILFVIMTKSFERGKQHKAQEIKDLLYIDES